MKEVEMLFRVYHHHYGPKSESHDIAYVVSCSTEVHLRDWLNKEKAYGAWNEEAEDEDTEVEDGKSAWTLYIYDDEDKKTAAALQRRAEMLNTKYGLDIACCQDEDTFKATATHRDLVLLHQGDDYEEGSDYYYGVHQWSWELIDAEDSFATRELLRDALGDAFVLLNAKGKAVKKDSAGK